jgi:hypothetical protein
MPLSRRVWRAAWRRGLVFPPVELRAQRLAAGGEHIFAQQAQPAQVQHHLRHAARHKHSTVAKPRGPLGSTSTRRGAARLARIQSSTVGQGSPAAWAMAGRCSSRLVDPPKAACRTSAFSSAAGVRISASAGQAALAQHASAERGQLQPDRLARRGQRAVRQGHAQRFGHHLGRWRPCPRTGSRRRSSRTPGSPSRRHSRARSAVGKARADRLHFAGVFRAARRQGHPAGDDQPGSSFSAGQGHHHGRQALVAGGDAQHALPGGQRARQAAHDDRASLR